MNLCNANKLNEIKNNGHKDMTLSNANKLNEIKNNGVQNNNENKTSDNNNSENKNNNIYSNYMVNNQINLNRKPTSTNEDDIKNINDAKPKSILKNCSNYKINKEKENKSISYGDNNLCEIDEDYEDNNNDINNDIN